MRARCPRCQYPHNVDAADMVANLLDDPAHKDKEFVVLPTRGVKKLTCVKDHVAKQVIECFEKFKEGGFDEAP
jgi:hypothetical protein